VRESSGKAKQIYLGGRAQRKTMHFPRLECVLGKAASLSLSLSLSLRKTGLQPRVEKLTRRPAAHPVTTDQHLHVRYVCIARVLRSEEIRVTGDRTWRRIPIWMSDCRDKAGLKTTSRSSLLLHGGAVNRHDVGSKREWSEWIRVLFARLLELTERVYFEFQSRILSGQASPRPP